MGGLFSNELQRPDYMAGHQDNNSSNDHQGDMPYFGGYNSDDHDRLNI